MKRKTKTVPISVRLDPEMEEAVAGYAARTGLPVPEIIRRCVNFGLPQFEGGHRNLLDYGNLQPTAEKS